MFSIRAAQISILSADLRQRFVERMTEMVAQDFPHVCEGQDATHVADWVEARFTEAGAAAIESSSDLRSWIQLAATHGEDFVEQPWAASVLSDSALTPSEKMGVLEERAMFVEISS